MSYDAYTYRHYIDMIPLEHGIYLSASVWVPVEVDHRIGKLRVRGKLQVDGLITLQTDEGAIAMIDTTPEWDKTVSKLVLTDDLLQTLEDYYIWNSTENAKRN